jgi:hypothetical protein
MLMPFEQFSRWDMGGAWFSIDFLLDISENFWGVQEFIK